MYWDYLPEWDAWFLMIRTDGTTSKCAYGPFMNNWEIQTAADMHGVPCPENHGATP